MTPETLRDLKASPGKTLLFYLSDYCPVGCAHCSVDALPSAPRAHHTRDGRRDLDHLVELCRGIRTLAEEDQLAVVGISGGEPLAERAALSEVVTQLAGYVKLVLFTSGLPWIGGREAPWASELLADIDTCVVSYSPFHERAIGREDYLIPVVEHILSRGCDVQIHALAEAAAHQALQTELDAMTPAGDAACKAGAVYLVPIPLLPVGRAARFSLRRPHKPLSDWGPCSLITAPVLRSDGHMVGCCNETLTRHPDDPALAWPARGADELVERFRAHAGSQLSERLRTRGPIALIDDLTSPARDRLAAREFDSICAACAATRGLYRAPSARPPIETQSRLSSPIDHAARSHIMNDIDPIEPHTRLTILDPDSERLIDQAAQAGAWVLQDISASDYHALLKNLYHIVMDSVPLMQRAAHVLDRQRPHQRGYLGRYREYLHHHIEEERDHDVWLLEDLAALQAAGINSDDRPVNENLARLMAAHWHALHNDNPWLLLGHMWTLESRPPSARGMRALRERLGLSADMTRTYDRHAADDPGHARDLIALIGDPALSPQIRADITLGARVTAAGVTRFWINLSEHAPAAEVTGAQRS